MSCLRLGDSRITVDRERKYRIESEGGGEHTGIVYQLTSSTGENHFTSVVESATNPYLVYYTKQNNICQQSANQSPTGYNKLLASIADIQL